MFCSVTRRPLFVCRVLVYTLRELSHGEGCGSLTIGLMISVLLCVKQTIHFDEGEAMIFFPGYILHLESHIVLLCDQTAIVSV